MFRSGQSFGLAYLEKLLTGAEDERLRARGHDQLSVFGIVSAGEAPLLRPLARALQARGSLEATEHGGLRLAGLGRYWPGGAPDPAALSPGERKLLLGSQVKLSCRCCSRLGAASIA